MGAAKDLVTRILKEYGDFLDRQQPSAERPMLPHAVAQKQLHIMRSVMLLIELTGALPLLRHQKLTSCSTMGCKYNEVDYTPAFVCIRCVPLLLLLYRRPPAPDGKVVHSQHPALLCVASPASS